MHNRFFAACLAVVLFFPVTDARAAINFCIPPTPSYPCIGVDTIVEMYQNGKAAPDLSSGAYVVMTPSASPTQQGPFNVIVLGNDWNFYAIDLTGNWWKWAIWTQTWSNLNTTQTPPNIGLPSGTTPPPPSNGPAAEWTLTQASISGTTVADASGNNNTATVVNGPLTFGTSGANFNGKQYVDSTLKVTSSALTVSVWFNATNLNGANPRIVANSHTDADNKGFQLMFNSGGGSGYFDVGNGTTNGQASWTQQLATGTWYNYVGVYDGATVIAYINGVQVASKPFTGGAIAAGTGPDINVGRNPTYAADYFAGAVSDVRIYNKALAAADVKALYNAGH